MELNSTPVGRGSLGQGLACYIWSPSCQLSVVFESFSVGSFFPGKFIFSPEECPAEASFHMCPKVVDWGAAEATAPCRAHQKHV